MSNETFQQDLDSENNSQNLVFVIQLLMKDECKNPTPAEMLPSLQKHIGDVEALGDTKIFSVNTYKSPMPIPPQLMVTDCTEFDRNVIDEFTVTQMWDCQQDRERILSECKFQVVATDLLAAQLDYKDRANMVMDYAQALLDIYPTCEAVYFPNSGKMFTADYIRSHDIPRDFRFIYLAVNVRFFNIEGASDFLVDTLGMETLFLPDLQYHFHDVDPNFVVNHAYNMLTYIYDKDNPIENGNTIDSIDENGEMDKGNMWVCHYEKSLVQPERDVIDIFMNENAAGERNYED